MTEDQAMSNHPKWLTEAIIQFNHDTTCENEFELVGLKVDLHRQPDLPQRLNLLFKALQKGFAGEATLMAGNFLELGYRILFGAAVKPHFMPLGQDAEFLRELDSMDDAKAVGEAYDHVYQQIKNEPRWCIVQLPYFIRKNENAGAPVTGKAEFEKFKSDFDNDRVLYVEPQTQDASGVRTWIRDHPREKYEQRFLITLGLISRNGFQDKIHSTEVKKGLAYLLGSFLSWAGMSAGDSTRYMVASAAARLATFSHDYLKPINKLDLYLRQHSEKLPADLVPALREICTRAELLKIDKEFEQQQKSFVELLHNAIMRTTDLPLNEPFIPHTKYNLKMALPRIHGMPITLSIENLPDPGVMVKFDTVLFESFMRNLLRNAVEHSSQDSAEVEIDCRHGEVYKPLRMVFRYKNSDRIDPSVRRKLFRVPIERDPAKGGGLALGLWTIGLTFDAQRLPLPTVSQEGKDLCITFAFHALMAEA